eukprot:RCo014019
MFPVLHAFRFGRRLGKAIQETAQLLCRYGYFNQGKFGQAEKLQRKFVARPYDFDFPEAGSIVYMAPTVSLIGSVKIGDKSSVWSNVTMRGDRGCITVGDNSHVMDNVTVCCGILSVRDVKVGNDVVIEPNVTLEPCQIGDGAYICAGAILMEGCRIQPGAVVGPRAVISQFQTCESGKIYLGPHPKDGRPLTKEEEGKYRVKLQAVAETAAKHGENYKAITRELLDEKTAVLTALEESAQDGAEHPEFRSHYFKNRRYQITEEGRVSLQ